MGDIGADGLSDGERRVLERKYEEPHIPKLLIGNIDLNKIEEIAAYLKNEGFSTQHNWEYGWWVGWEFIPNPIPENYPKDSDIPLSLLTIKSKGDQGEVYLMYINKEELREYHTGLREIFKEKFASPAPFHV